MTTQNAPAGAPKTIRSDGLSTGSIEAQKSGDLGWRQWTSQHDQQTAKEPSLPQSYLEPTYSFGLPRQAVFALRFVAELLPRVGAEPYLWKWIVIGVHDALHGFMGLALQRTDGAQLRGAREEQRIYDRWNRERLDRLAAKPLRKDPRPRPDAAVVQQ